MSDLLEVDRKIQEGADWRGTVEVSFDEREVKTDESGTPVLDDDGNEVEVPIKYELTHRQLKEAEFAQAIEKCGQENFEEKIRSLETTTSGMDHDDLQTYRELSGKDPDSLTEDERDTLESIAQTADSDSIGSILNLMDTKMIDGLHYAAKCGVVPDEDDVQEYLNMSPPEMQKAFGEMVQTENKMRDKLDSRINSMIDDSVGFTAYSVGLEVLFSSMDSEGN